MELSDGVIGSYLNKNPDRQAALLNIYGDDYIINAKKELEGIVISMQTRLASGNHGLFVDCHHVIQMLRSCNIL